MSPEIFNTRTAQIWIRDDGLTQVHIRQGIREEVADAKENIATISKMNQGKPVPILVDLRDLASLDREVSSFYSSEESVAVSKALGLLVKSKFQEVMINFFIDVNRPAVPTRMFTSEDEAIAWLKTFL